MDVESTHSPIKINLPLKIIHPSTQGPSNAACFETRHNLPFYRGKSISTEPSNEFQFLYCFGNLRMYDSNKLTY